MRGRHGLRARTGPLRPAAAATSAAIRLVWSKSTAPATAAATTAAAAAAGRRRALWLQHANGSIWGWHAAAAAARSVFVGKFAGAAAVAVEQVNAMPS